MRAACRSSMQEQQAQDYLGWRSTRTKTSRVTRKWWKRRRRRKRTEIRGRRRKGGRRRRKGEGEEEDRTRTMKKIWRGQPVEENKE